MPETYIPEPEPTRAEVAASVIAEVVAGQHIVRRVLLYALTAFLLVTPVAPLAVVPLVLLMATDGGLA